MFRDAKIGRKGFCVEDRDQRAFVRKMNNVDRIVNKYTWLVVNFFFSDVVDRLKFNGTDLAGNRM